MLFSGDLQILEDPLEQRILAEANIITYFTYRGFTTAGKWNHIKWLVRIWDDVIDHCATEAVQGINYQVSLNGAIKIITSYQDFE